MRGLPRMSCITVLDDPAYPSLVRASLSCRHEGKATLFLNTPLFGLLITKACRWDGLTLLVTNNTGRC